MPQTIRLLIIEDDEDDYFLLTDVLTRIDEPIKHDWAPRFSEARSLLEENQYDIALIDYRLGGENGIEIINYMHQNYPEVPCILLTGLQETRLGDQALEMGAYDYLVKGEFTPDSLRRSMKYAVEKARIIHNLNVSEAQYRNLYQKSSDGIFIVNEHLIIINSNESSNKIIHECDQTNTRKITHFIQGLSHCETIHDLINELKLHENNGAEVVIGTSDGEDCKDCVLRYSEIFQDKLYQVILADITEKKSIEKRKKIIEQQTITGKVARLVAHEIKNPLTNIYLSLSEMNSMSSEIADAKQREGLESYLGIINRNAERINVLLENLLNATKFDSFNLGEVNLTDVIETALEGAIDRIRLKGIKLNVDTGSKQLIIDADTEKLKIALLNLIINAVEAINSDPKEIWINVKDQNNLVELIVKDSGDGIPAENIPRLFEPFYTSKPTGTGLGLSAVYSIISRHNGEIKVQSTPGQGTSFMIVLPLKQPV